MRRNKERDREERIKNRERRGEERKEEIGKRR